MWKNVRYTGFSDCRSLRYLAHTLGYKKNNTFARSWHDWMKTNVWNIDIERKRQKKDTVWHPFTKKNDKHYSAYTGTHVGWCKEKWIDKWLVKLGKRETKRPFWHVNFNMRQNQKKEARAQCVSVSTFQHIFSPLVAKFAVRALFSQAPYKWCRCV